MTKKEIPNEIHEDYQEMETTIYYLKGQANYIQKEESNQFFKKCIFQVQDEDFKLSKGKISEEE